MDFIKKKKHTRIFTIFSICLLMLGYLTMILMYASLKNNNMKGNYLAFILYLLVVIIFMCMVGGSIGICIDNIQSIKRVLSNDELPKELKKSYIIMLILNGITLVGCALFLPIWSEFTK